MTAIRIFTGPAEMVVGLLLIGVAVRLWVVPPINRVFRLGPFVTDAGMRAVLRLRLTFFAIGATLLSGGSARTLFWWDSRDPYNEAVALAGSLEAGFSAWALTLVVYKAVRLWRLQ